MLFSANEIREYCPNKIQVGDMLWPFKHTIEKFNILSSGDPYTTSAQYQQNPSMGDGGMFKFSWWKYYDVVPSDINQVLIFCDTAQKTGEKNDYTVFQCWARSPSKGLFLLDQIRDKFEAPELESSLVQFWDKHKPSIFRPMGASAVYIEDKSSGSSLIQTLRKDYLIPIEAIQRNTDKVLRAYGVVRYVASGYVHLPKGEPWLAEYTKEFGRFTPMMTHKHDDQIDPTVDAIENMLVFNGQLYTKEALR